MRKQEAAKFLGVSERTLEKYSSDGMLTIKYEKGKTRSVAVFDPDELATLKTQMEQEATKEKSVELSNPEKTELVKFGVTILTKIDSLVEAIQAVNGNKQEIKQLSNVRTEITVPITAKLLLSKKEAAALAGLSIAKIEELLKTKQLKGYLNQYGNGWKIKREDLETFIKNLK